MNRERERERRELIHLKDCRDSLIRSPTRSSVPQGTCFLIISISLRLSRTPIHVYLGNWNHHENNISWLLQFLQGQRQEKREREYVWVNLNFVPSDRRIPQESIHTGGHGATHLHSAQWPPLVRTYRPAGIYQSILCAPASLHLFYAMYLISVWAMLQVTNARGLKLSCSWWQPQSWCRAKQVTHHFPLSRQCQCNAFFWFLLWSVQKLPCVVYMHGNCGCRANAFEILPYILPLNATVFAFDFAGCGHSEGTRINLFLTWFRQWLKRIGEPVWKSNHQWSHVGPKQSQ